MEDKIKALIEEYENQLKQIKPDDWWGELLLLGFICDLRQLLTTSQGNPERMV